MKTFLQKHLDDVLIVGGCGLLVVATALVSLIGAMYMAGGLMIILGVLVGMGNGRNA